MKSRKLTGATLTPGEATNGRRVYGCDVAGNSIRVGYKADAAK